MAAVRTAAALSEHPLATHAVGECVGQLLEHVGTGADLLVVAVTPPLLGALDDVAGTARALLGPTVTLALGASSVLGGPREVDQRAAVSMFALGTGGAAPPSRPVRLWHHGTGPSGTAPDDDRWDGAAGTLLLFADAHSFPLEPLLDDLARRAPQLLVVGGTASAASHPGGNRLVLDDAAHTDGAVGVLLPPEVGVRAVVSQGGRPVGSPLTVTGTSAGPTGRSAVVTSLAGRPAADRRDEALDPLVGTTLEPARRACLLGRVVDERVVDVGRADLLARPVVGEGPDAGSLRVADEVAVGDTVQFLVRDATTAHEDLQELVGPESAAGALVLASSARGARLFGEPDHDAALVHEALDGAPVAGVVTGAEVGPVGGRSFVHGASATVVLFG